MVHAWIVLVQQQQALVAKDGIVMQERCCLVARKAFPVKLTIFSARSCCLHLPGGLLECAMRSAIIVSYTSRGPGCAQSARWLLG